MISRTEGKARLKSQSTQSPAAKGVVGKGTAKQGPAPPLLHSSFHWAVAWRCLLHSLELTPAMDFEVPHHSDKGKLWISKLSLCKGHFVTAADSARSAQQSHRDDQCLLKHPSSFLLRFASEKLLVLFLFLLHPHSLPNYSFRLLSWKAQTRAGSAFNKSDKLFSCGHSPV